MSENFARDIREMHAKFGLDEWIDKASKDDLEEFLRFRISMIEEELNELKEAVENRDPEEVVDALVDISVFAIGTMDAFYVTPRIAWTNVHAANMAKEPGVKPERPNPLGLPDMLKPEGWQAPSHEGNHGALREIFED